MKHPYILDKEHKVHVQVYTSDSGGPCRYFILNDIESKQPSAYLSLLHDLVECETILDLLKPFIKDENVQFQIKSGLYFSVVILYARCYNKADGRGVMLQREVFKGKDPALLKSHIEIMTVRNQYLAHAGNSRHEDRTMVLYFHPGENNYAKMEPKVGVNKHQFEHTLDKYYEVIATTKEYVQEKLKTVLPKFKKHLLQLDMNVIYRKSKTPDPKDYI